jgi:TonB family protein
MVRSVRWLCLAATFPAAAQQPIPSSSAAVWRADWAAPYCELASGDPDNFSVVIQAIPGNGSAQLYFPGSRGHIPKLPRGSNLWLQLSPSGATMKAAAVWLSPEWKGVTYVFPDDFDSLKSIEAANRASIVAGAKTTTIALPTTGDALQAFHRCLSDKARAWEVDLAALDALKQRPKQMPGQWLSSFDYPRDAIAALKEGSVVTRLTADASGHVTDCTVVENTGTRSMEQPACTAAFKPGRFEPAIGADGRPVPVTFTTTTKFSLNF